MANETDWNYLYKIHKYVWTCALLAIISICSTVYFTHKLSFEKDIKIEEIKLEFQKEFRR